MAQWKPCRNLRLLLVQDQTRTVRPMPVRVEQTRRKRSGRTEPEAVNFNQKSTTLGARWVPAERLQSESVADVGDGIEPTSPRYPPIAGRLGSSRQDTHCRRWSDREAAFAAF